MFLPSVPPPASPGWWTLVNAAWFSLLMAIVLSAVSLYAAWIFYKRGKPRPSVMVTGDSSLLVGQAGPETQDRLKILYEGIEVPRVTSTTIGLWNAGNTTFRSHDIVGKDPLRIEVTDGTVLRVEVERVSRPVIAVAAQEAKSSEVNIIFDFFEPQDAFSILLLHSGSVQGVHVTGTLIGLPSGVQQFRPKSPFSAFGKWIDRLGLAAVGVAILAFEIWQISYGSWKGAILPPVFLVGFFLFVMALVWCFERVNNYWTKSVPSSVLENARLKRRLDLDNLLGR